MAARKRKAVDQDGDGGGASTMRKKAADKSGTSKKKARAPATTTRITRHTARNMTIDAPRQAVFNTAELIENIFTHLPPRTIFGVQRVCRQFRDIVATSSRLRKMLLLQAPDPTNKERWTWIQVNSIPKYNLMRIIEGEDTAKLFRSLRNRKPCMYQPATQHSAVLDPVYHASTADRLHAGGDRLRVQAGKFGLLAPASWKATYPTDRPCNSALVAVEWGVKSTVDEISGTIKEHVTTAAPAGFTLGGIVDAVLHLDLSKAKNQWLISDREWHERQESLLDMFTRLEAETRKRAVIESLEITMDDVILTAEEDWEQVSEDRASLMAQGRAT